MASRVVPPHTTVLTLANGDTLIVKTRLNHGEQRAAFARMYVPGVNGDLRMNPLIVGDTMVCAYLIDWSLRDPDGHPIVIRGASPDEIQQALDSLDPADVAEIRTAIEVHEQRVIAARAAEKKTPSGSNGADPISPSPSAAAGVSSGSVN